MSGTQPTRNTARVVRIVLSDPILLVGIAASILLFSSMVLSIFTPLPLLYFYFQRGRIIGLTMIGLAGLIIGLLFSIFPNVSGLIMMMLFLEYSLLAGVMGECLHRRLSLEKIIGYPALSLLALGVLVLIVSGFINGQNPLNYARVMAESQVKESIALYRDILTGKKQDAQPLPGPGQKEDLKAEDDRAIKHEGQDSAFKDTEMGLNQLTRSLVLIFPGLTVIGTILIGWINFMLSRILFKRVGTLPPHLGDLTRWKPPEFLIWAVIFCGFGMFLPVAAIRFIGVNGILVLSLVYFLAGLSVIAFWFNLKQVPRFFRIITYILIAVQQILTLLVVGLGLFDFWFDFRKLKNTESGPAS